MRKPRTYIDSLIYEIAEEMAAKTINRSYIMIGFIAGFIFTLPFSFYILFTIMMEGTK